MARETASCGEAELGRAALPQTVSCLLTKNMGHAVRACGSLLEASAIVRVMSSPEPQDFPRSSSGAAFDQGDFPAGGKKSVPRSVLIVDDEPLIRWSLAEIFGDCGYEVAVAGDAAEAVRAVSTASPGFDAVLLDLRLPDSNDFALLTRLRRAAPTARIILMTAYYTPEMKHLALRLGADCVLNKPFEMNDLPSLVEGSQLSLPSSDLRAMIGPVY